MNTPDNITSHAEAPPDARTDGYPEKAMMPGGAKDGTANDGAASGESPHRYRDEFITGVVVLVALAGLFLGVRFMSGLPLFGGSRILVADFRDAGGLAEGRAVMMSGLKVGTVAGLSLRPQGVRARLRIDEDVKVPRGSVARLSGFAALDNVQVAIDRGPPQAPALSDGAEIPTESGGLLEMASERIEPMAARLDSTLRSAEGAFGAAERLLRGSQKELPAALRSLRGAATAAEALLREQRGPLRDATANLKALTAKLDRLAGALQQYTEGAGGDTLRATIRTMNRTLRETRRTAASLRRSASELEQLLRSINRGEGTLGKLVHDPSLYNHLDSSAARLSRVLAGFEKDPGRYLKQMQLVDIF